MQAGGMEGAVLVVDVSSRRVEEWHKTLHTKLDQLAWLCPHHHALKSRKGHRLEGSVGSRRWLDAQGRLLAADTSDPPTGPFP